MKIYPAIDIMGGRCVRLYQGKFDSVSLYDTNPVEVAKRYAEAGAQFLHVVDLDGARAEKSRQMAIFEQIGEETKLKVQAGGGIRSQEQVTTCLKGGISRVVVGSLAILNPEAFRDLLKKFGSDAITLAVDIRWNSRGEPVPATAGWRDEGSRALWNVLDDFSDTGLRHILCTDITRDGTLDGPNVTLYEKLRERYPQFKIQASGGIGKLADLKDLQVVGVAAAIVGKALYEKRFTIEEALKC
jgi:phosphoribosylformimino-5-aminoimidazole carboxamide ribotide isomerase